MQSFSIRENKKRYCVFQRYDVHLLGKIKALQIVTPLLSEHTTLANE